MQNSVKLLMASFLLLSLLSYYIVKNNKAIVEQENIFIADLQSQINEIDSIVISKNNQTVSLNKDLGTWKIKEVNNFIADTNMVANLLLDLRKFKLKEKKTTNKNNYGMLSLAESGENAASKIILSKKGEIVSHVAIGKQAKKGQGTYVKENSSSQTWLSQGVLKINLNPQQWIVKTLFDIEVNNIKSVTFKSTEEESFSIDKLTPQDPLFVLQNLSENKQLVKDVNLNDMANGLKKFTIQSIYNKNNLPESSILEVAYQLFNGVEYRLDFYQQEGLYVMKVNMVNITSGFEFEQQLNQWAYVVPDFKFDALNKKLSDITQDISTIGLTE